MKIIHVSYTFFDGFAYQDNEIAKIQARMGHDVVVIALEKDYYTALQGRNIPDKQHTYISNGYKVRRIRLKYKWNFRFNKFAGLYQILEEEKPDLILFHQTPYMSMLDVVRYKRKYSNVKIYLDFHCDYYNSGLSFLSRVFLHKTWYRFLTRITRKYVDMYYYITPKTKKFVKEMYLISDDKLEFLPLGCDIEEVDYGNRNDVKRDIRSHLGIPMDDLVIITGGKLDEVKNTHSLIEAYQKLDMNNVHLVIFGEAIEDKYNQLLIKLAKGNSNIHFVGWLTSAEVQKYYLASDLACFPGGQSAVWQQAIVCGLPFLCPRWDGIEYLNVDNNVIFIEDVNVDSIFENLKLILGDDALRSRMAFGAINQGRDFFSYQNIVQKVSK